MTTAVRIPRRRWTHTEYVRAERLLANGKRQREVAQQIGRTREALALFLKRARTGKSPAANGSWTLASIRRLFRTYYVRVQQWIAEGLLVAQHDVRRGPWRITDKALRAFLADRRAWMDWSPAGIGDPVWRAEAERLRAEADGEWLTCKDVARRLYWSDTKIRLWCERGVLPAIKRRNTWYVWSADLDGFVPPERKRG